MPTGASDFFDLARDLEAAAVAVPVAGAAAAHHTADQLETKAKAAAPVLSGELRDSTSATVTTTGLVTTVSLGATSDHTLEVEFGTSVMAAEPFLGPAFDQELPAFEREADQAIGRLL